jgi:NAD(P)-dependent dehydrogenase (short-subunit alcohol dehydrogenase family)
VSLGLESGIERRVLITGASGGIGGEVAKRFVARGAVVCLADLRLDAAEELAREIARAGGKATPVPVDIRDPASVAHMVGQAVDALGHIDVLVHCAGLDAPRGVAWELDDRDHWDRILDVDLNGAWRCARAVIPHMLARGSGRIIFMGSVAGRRGSASASVAYSAAKAGIHGLTMALARQLEGQGILVKAIAPGPTGTGEPMTETERLQDEQAYALPIVGPRPVADACLYLAGESGDWITGTILNVSGGRWHG